MRFQDTVIFTKPRKGFEIKTLEDARLFIKGFRGTQDFEVVVPDVKQPAQVYYLIRREGKLLFGKWAFKYNAIPISEKLLAQRIYDARDSINAVFK